MILFFCNFWSNKAEKACFCGFVFLFSNGNLKNTFIFNFQLSTFNFQFFPHPGKMDAGSSLTACAALMDGPPPLLSLTGR